MRPCTQAALLAACLAVASAAAAPADAIRTLEGELALDRAHELAGKGLHDRAKAILDAVAKTHPGLADRATTQAAAIEQAAAKADKPSGPPEYREALDKARKNGPPMDPKRQARTAKALQRANALMDQGKCGTALPTYRSLARSKSQGACVQEARDCVEIIEKLGDTLLSQAREAAEGGQFAAAVPRLLLLQRDFAGTRAAGSAKAQLEKLKAIPQARAAIAAATALLTGEAAEPEHVEPKKPTTIATKVGRSPDEARAHRLVQLAKNYAANNMTERAKALLKKVLDKYPHTDAAAQGRALLGEIE